MVTYTNHSKPTCFRFASGALERQLQDVLHEPEAPAAPAAPATAAQPAAAGEAAPPTTAADPALAPAAGQQPRQPGADPAYR